MYYDEFLAELDAVLEKHTTDGKIIDIVAGEVKWMDNELKLTKADAFTMFYSLEKLINIALEKEFGVNGRNLLGMYSKVYKFIEDWENG